MNMNMLQEMRKKIIKSKKIGVSVDSVDSEPKKDALSPLLGKNKSEEIHAEDNRESKQIEEKVIQISQEKRDQEQQIQEKQQISLNQSSNQREEKKIFPIDPLFPNKSTNEFVFQRDTIKKGENEFSNPELNKKGISIENNEEVGKKSEEKKTIKVILKEVQQIKEAVGNLQYALKGLEYIEEKVKKNPKYREKIKEKLHVLREIFE